MRFWCALVLLTVLGARTGRARQVGAEQEAADTAQLITLLEHLVELRLVAQEEQAAAELGAGEQMNKSQQVQNIFC